MKDPCTGIRRSTIVDLFDVIVIGGGWGGLATGALLARRGLSVLLVEARASPGGRASYRERDGFLVDYGIHAHRFGRNGAAAGVYRELGERLDLVDPAGGFVYHRGRFHDIPEKKGGLARVDMVSARARLALARHLAGLAARRPGRNYDVPVADLIKDDIDPEARSMLSVLAGLGLISANLESTSAGEFIWFLKRAARAGTLVSFPREGCRQHVERLGAIIRAGGEIRCGFRVRRVILEKGAAAGVEGREGGFRSRAVVCAFPLPSVAGLLPGDALGPTLSYRMGGIRPTCGLSWDAALRRRVTEAGVVFSTDPLIIGGFTSNLDESICPPDRQFSTWCMPLQWSDFESAARIRAAENRLRDHVLHMFPALEESILWERMMRLPVLDGAMPAYWQPWPDRPGVADSGVPGLFFAGDTVGVPGQSGDIAFQSAVECAGAVTAYLD